MTTADASNTVAQGGLSRDVDLLVVVLLIGLLIFKEITTSVSDSQARVVGRILDIVLAPLLFVYGVIVIVRVLQVWK